MENRNEIRVPGSTAAVVVLVKLHFTHLFQRVATQRVKIDFVILHASTVMWSKCFRR